MPRIIPVDNLQFPDERDSSSTMGMLFRVMGHRPEIMRQARELLEVTMRQGTVDSKLKELLAVRVSQVNHCYY